MNPFKKFSLLTETESITSYNTTMEREIKFRAWDGTRMIFLSDLSIGLKKGKRISPYAYFATDTFGNHVSILKHKMMQFSGLKDRNGKEIYEEDIVDISKFEGSAIYRMVINDIMQMPNELYGSNVDWYEVVGNRIQNPELLK